MTSIKRVDKFSLMCLLVMATAQQIAVELFKYIEKMGGEILAIKTGKGICILCGTCTEALLVIVFHSCSSSFQWNSPEQYSGEGTPILGHGREIMCDDLHLF